MPDQRQACTSATRGMKMQESPKPAWAPARAAAAETGRIVRWEACRDNRISDDTNPA
jgi:hypothetical protein